MSNIRPDELNFWQPGGKTDLNAIQPNDLHTLYDRGYLTIIEDQHIEMSKRIKEDYGNGKEYWAMHGHNLAVVPDYIKDKLSNGNFTSKNIEAQDEA